MSDQLRPCPACLRHCRNEPSCPFCGAPLVRPAPRSTTAAIRITRAAIFASAAIVAPACSAPTSPPGGHGSPGAPGAQGSQDSPRSGSSGGAVDPRVAVGRLAGTLTNARTGAPAPGQAIFVTRGAVQRSTTTADNGTYAFDDLPAGDYEVEFPLPPRHVVTGEEPPTRVTIHSGEVTVVDKTILVYEPSSVKMPYGAPPMRQRRV